MVRSSNARSHFASPRRARRRDARRDAILRAAAAIFRDRGFAATGMRDIADAADLSPANLYHYFRGKDEILFYCQDRALDRMLAAVAAARRRDQSRGRTAAGRARRPRPHAARRSRRRDGASRGRLALAAPARAESSPSATATSAPSAAWSPRASRAASSCRSDAAVVTRAMLGALNWTVTWFRPDGRTTAAEVAESIAAFLVRGLAAGSSRRPPPLRFVPGGTRHD